MIFDSNPINLLTCFIFIFNLVKYMDAMRFMACCRLRAREDGAETRPPSFFRMGMVSQAIQPARVAHFSSSCAEW